MPPKNKKQLEQQAKRLEQQQRLKQEEQAKLQIQRKKYAQQTIQTGLILPVSNQLVLDFPTKQLIFIQTKLKQILNSLYPGLSDVKIIKQIVKQLSHHIKNLRNVFLLDQTDEEMKKKLKLLKIRVLIGILLQTYFNEHPAVQGKGKIKQQDQKLFKNILLQHCQKIKQKQIKVFQKNQISVCLQFARQNYFNHFKILHNFNKFSKRKDERQNFIYISCPTIEFNNKHTEFIDLAQNQQGIKKQLKQEK